MLSTTKNSNKINVNKSTRRLTGSTLSDLKNPKGLGAKLIARLPKLAQIILKNKTTQTSLASEI
jgi:hypothetical protein